MKSELIKWRIQVRENRGAKWKNHSGLFETRWMAVHQARRLREGTAEGEGFGRGNVQVIRHVRKVQGGVTQALGQRTPNPIVPGNKSERTGSAGIMRRAVAEIARRYQGLSRDVLAVFARHPGLR